MTGTDPIPPLPEENELPQDAGHSMASASGQDDVATPPTGQKDTGPKANPVEPDSHSISELAQKTGEAEKVSDDTSEDAEAIGTTTVPAEPALSPDAAVPPSLPNTQASRVEHVVPVLPPAYTAAVPPRPALRPEEGPATPPPRPFGFIPTPPNYTGPTGSQYEKKPRSFLMEAIVLTVLLCQPLGIVAIINASNVNSRYYNGDYYGARLASEAARRWIIWGLVLAVAVGLAVVGLEFLLSFGLFSED